jgi:hypothetical protein
MGEGFLKTIERVDELVFFFLADGRQPLFLMPGGSIGRLIVGWLTTRHEVFPTWVGWAFIVEGLLNPIGAVIDLGALTDAYVAIIILAATVALLGDYLLRPRATPGLS